MRDVVDGHGGGELGLDSAILEISNVHDSMSMVRWVGLHSLRSLFQF